MNKALMTHSDEVRDFLVENDLELTPPPKAYVKVNRWSLVTGDVNWKDGSGGATFCAHLGWGEFGVMVVSGILDNDGGDCEEDCCARNSIDMHAVDLGDSDTLMKALNLCKSQFSSWGWWYSLSNMDRYKWLACELAQYGSYGDSCKTFKQSNLMQEVKEHKY